jgi:uncharacterized Tic20 family protein
MNLHIVKRKDNQLLVITHLSQLITLITGFGGLIVPLIMWTTHKDTVYNMDAHGKAVINFQLSLIVYSLICVPLVFFCGLGIVLLLLLAVVAFVFPIINAVKTSNGELPKYPLTFKFIN